MANVISFKKGVEAATLDAVLSLAEPLFETDTGRLYVGDGNGGKVLINADSTGAADVLSTAREFTITGDGAAGPVAFNGSANVALALTLAASGVVAGEYTKVTVDAKGRITEGDALEASDIPSLTLAKITDAGTAAAKDTGTQAGNVPVIGADGKLENTILPSLTITDVYVVASEEDMLGITGAEQGDVAIRSDIKKTYILTQTPASTLANWTEFLSPDSPVQSVNGQTGTVVITNITGNAGTATALETAREINGVEFDGTENITITDATKEPIITPATADMYWNGLKQFVSLSMSVRDTLLAGIAFDDDDPITADDTILEAFGKTQAQLNLKAPLDSPVFTGTPTVPTPVLTSNGTQAVNAAFVKGQGYLDENSRIDGGWV